ncbi:LysR family transcriptional regulator [Moorella sp. E306M]|uniref:LysR substrate-binding domain-containing protein n=1 Tax=Moorella sp. E306M TaxID=2572683 RepID=UPI0010FFB3DB|nr:LysR family transcriptional regulator [Moorella sp. E306M]GEA17030.1 LysR family transcriptional regulator [Moorella sp. E306M]
MKIDYMREYIALAENLNFTETANKLFMTQPALSRHIAVVEEQMGIQLLKRTKQSVELTPAGKLVLEEFKKIIKQYDALMSQIRLLSSGFTGELKIGMLYYAIEEYVTPVVELFKDNYPGVKLSFLSYQPRPLVQNLLEDKIDLGLIMRLPFPHSDLIRYHKICREKLAIMVLADDPLAAKKIVSIKELVGKTIVFSQSDIELSEYIQHLLATHGVYPKRFIYSEHVDTISFTMAEVQGVAIVPSHLRIMRRKNIDFVDIDEDDFFLEMCWAYKFDNNNPAIPLFLKQVNRIFAGNAKER